MHESQQSSDLELSPLEREERVHFFRLRCAKYLVNSEDFNRSTGKLFLRLDIASRLFDSRTIEFAAKNSAYKVSRSQLVPDFDGIEIEKVEAYGTTYREERVSLVTRKRTTGGNFSYTCFENGKKIFEGENTQVTADHIDNFLEKLNNDTKPQE